MQECLSWRDAEMEFYTRADQQLPKGNLPWGTHKSVLTYYQFVHAWETLVSLCGAQVESQLAPFVEGRDVFVAYVVHVPQRKFRTINIVPLLDGLGILHGEGIYRLVFETRRGTSDSTIAVTLWSTHYRTSRDPASVCHLGVIERQVGAKPLVESSLADVALRPQPSVRVQPTSTTTPVKGTRQSSSHAAIGFRNQRLMDFVEYIQKHAQNHVTKLWQSMVEGNPAVHFLLWTNRNRRQEVALIETGSGNETVVILKSVVGLLGDGSKAIAVLQTLKLQSVIGMYVDAEGYLCLTQRIVVMHRMKPDFCADVVALAQRADELEEAIYRDDRG